jgi:sigma-B regulation protein RsbU (phosphoserine phosphatase)
MLARVHTLIAAEASLNRDPGDVLCEVNESLANLDLSSHLTTAIYGILDCEKGEFSYARAGHEQPVMLTRDGKIQHFPFDRGTALGLLDNILLDEQIISIPPGETLLLYTDGLVDCRNLDGSSFGYEGIENNLVTMRGLSAQEICERFLVLINEYKENTEQYDDITILALQANSN